MARFQEAAGQIDGRTTTGEASSVASLGVFNRSRKSYVTTRVGSVVASLLNSHKLGPVGFFVFGSSIILLASF